MLSPLQQDNLLRSCAFNLTGEASETVRNNGFYF